jgi:uncharacterized protein YbjT (DUF2867 family)
LLLGISLTEGFLHPQFREKYSEVIVFTRDASKEPAKAFTAKGVKVVEVDYSQDYKELIRHFNGVDIFVDILGNGAQGSGLVSRDKLMRAAAASGSVKVYIPSDYGV